MKKIIISLIAIITIMNLYSQNQDIAYPHIVPMSPNAAEFAKYSDTPVSYYSGTPNINIPLYEIDVDGFKLPINLNYHASGIRVDQEATWVGLGWSLNVGSSISRTVKSADDFLMNWDRNYPRILKGYYDAPDISANLDNHYEVNGYLNCAAFFGSPEYDLIYDPEPDIFYYNLPNINGKFILDKSRGAVLFDKSHNLKIDVIKNSNNVTFKITDKEGNQYLYNQWEITRNYTSNGSLNKNIHSSNAKYDDEIGDYTQWTYIRFFECDDTSPWDASAQNPYPMVTSWCLSKIITAHGREIDFNYVSETQYLPTQESCENYHYNTQNALYYQKSKIVNTALRLSSIEGDFGRVEFNGSDRFDIKGTSKKLETLSVYNSTSTLIKSYKFDYSYFNDDYSGNYQYEHVFKRLKLLGVKEYKSNYYTNTLNNGYTFDYYDGNFPPKNSKNVDYWGFQNGSNYSEKYYIGLRINENTTFDGVKKDANFNKAIIGTLNKITYPTGGTIEYKFESNTFSSPYLETNTRESTYSSSNLTNLPVFNNYVSNDSFMDYPSQDKHTFEIYTETTIKIKCQLENVMGTRDLGYSYESYGNPLGELRRISPIPNNIFTYVCPPVWDWSISQPQGEGGEITLPERQFTLQPGVYEFEAFTPPNDVYAGWQLFIDNFNPLPTGTLPGPYFGGGIRIKEIKTDAKSRYFKYPAGTMLVEPVLYYLGRRIGIPDNIASCYVQVSESKTPLSTFNGGTIVGYDWVIEDSNYDEDDNYSRLKYTYHNETESDFFDDSFPDSPHYLNYTNGLVKSIEKYKSESSNTTLLEKNEFTYKSTYSNYINVFRDRGQKRHDNDLLQYYYKIEWPLQSKNVTTLNTDDGKSIVTETNYTYNTRDLIQSTSYNLNESEIIQKVKYPFDFTDAVSIDMVDKNMIGMHVEEFSLKDNLVVQGTKTQYFNNSGLYLPKLISRTEFNSPVTESNYVSYYKPVLNFDKYDSNGNLLEVSKVNSAHIYYIWGYNSQYPIAKLENFTANDATTIQSVITVAVNASNADNSLESENLLRLALTNLRNSASNAMVTTFTYDPLIGVTSITDPKGYTIFYTYDEFNRLKFVKDAQENILNKNEYNYKQ